jgi:hypothetical protein
MPADDFLLRATAWASLLAWACSERLKSATGAAWPRESRARALFAGGLVALAVHSVLALGLRYGWSHAAAARDTARQTEEVTGLGFTGGLYVNELFLLLWAVELLWWWHDPSGYRGRGRAFEWPVRAFFLTMFVSGAIVFAHGPVRWAGAAAVLAVAWAWYRGAGAHEGPAHG